MKAVIFDCDGVLVDSEIIVVKEKIKALNTLNINYKEEDFIPKYLGLGEDDFYKKISVEIKEGYKKVLSKTFREEIDAILKKKLNEELIAIPGMQHLLETIKIPKCVASSNNATGLKKKLQFTHLYDYFFPHIFSGDTVKKGKPEPDLFLLAAEKMNILPGFCYVIEDSINGIIAAKEAGMIPIGFTGGAHKKYVVNEDLKKYGARYVFHSAESLEHFLVKNAF